MNNTDTGRAVSGRAASGRATTLAGLGAVLAPLITEEGASLAFMQRHKDRFDDKLMRDRSIEVAGLAADIESSKVRTGQVGESARQLSPQVVAELDSVWQQRITAELGFASYADMIATLNRT